MYRHRRMWLRCVCCVFKQKTADEVRISDWSSDVCSSDLASGPSSSKAKRNVAWVQTSTFSSLARNSPTALTFDLATFGSSAPGVLHRFNCGATVQSVKKQNLLNGSLPKLAPIERYGTQMMACRTSWLAALSRR